MTPLRRALLLLVTLGSVEAHAGNDGFYIGGAIGESQERFDPSTYAVSGNDTGYKIIGGFRPIDVVAGEINYVSFGRASGGPNYADTYGVGVFALGFVPIPIVDLYGRLGLVNWRTNINSPQLSFRRTGSDLAYGGGLGTSWGKLGVRFEYEAYDVSHANTMNLASLGVTWTFL